MSKLIETIDNTLAVSLKMNADLLKLVVRLQKENEELRAPDILEVKIGNCESAEKEFKEPRASLYNFSIKMEEVLKKNDYKGGWENDPILSLYRKAQQEMQELDNALLKPSDAENAKLECLDVANYMLMIFDNLSR